MYSFILEVVGVNVNSVGWIVIVSDGIVVVSGVYGEIVVVVDVQIGMDYVLIVMDLVDFNCG